MSKHKVTRYDGEEGSEVSAEDEAAMDAYGRFVESGPKAMTMPRRPISRTPTAPSRMAGPGRKPSGPSRADYSNEGKGDSKYRKQTMTPESQALEKVYPEQYLIGGPGIKGVATAAQNLARTGAKEAPEVVSAARGALDRAMSAERASPKTGDMAKINDALKAFKNKPALKAPPAVAKAAEKAAPAVSTKRAAPNPKIMEEVNEGLKAHKARLAAKEALKPRARPKAEIKRDAIIRADTLDEFGGAMKRGGSVKRYASGGSTGSFRSSANGIAQRGKTRGKMC